MPLDAWMDWEDPNVVGNEEAVMSKRERWSSVSPAASIRRSLPCC